MPQKKYYLSINEPCTQSWEQMALVPGGRFCRQCQKTVMDISGMDDAALARLLAHTETLHCIRACRTQLDRAITLPPQPPTLMYQMVIALGLVLTAAPFSETAARIPSPLVSCVCPPSGTDTTDKNNGTKEAQDITITGTIIDETGTPFEGVKVRLLEQGIVLSMAVTDSGGRYRMRTRQPDLTKHSWIEMTAIGYREHGVYLKSGQSNEKMITIPVVQLNNPVVLGGCTYEQLKRPKPLMEPAGRNTHDALDLKRMGF